MAGVIKRRKFLVSVVVGVVAVASAAYLYSSGLLLRPTIPRLKIYLDQDKCRRCGMVISRLEYAAAIYVEGEQDWWKYDDLKCALQDYLEYTAKGVKILGFKVYDFDTGEEIEAEDAIYVKACPKKLWTPMSSGIVAVKDRERAESIAHKYDEAKARVLTFEEILKAVKEMPKPPSHQEKHGHEAGH